ncbi:putative pantothenate transporter [Mycena venus]|uniref:Putative pantothenate transporter n=1 Tax=Mycena venus TaxID=2733690 RepID=A0A8H6YP23_9AGAR|nr:putative pantothenate transporter [Mycena venus]
MSADEKSPSPAKSAEDIASFIQPVYDIRSFEEDRLRSKFDKRIMPLVCSVSLCFLDRVNVGFASVAGLQKSLGLEGVQYNIGLTCFYTTAAVFSSPNNLLGKHFGMGRWLAGCTLGFGICCMCSAFVRNYGEFCLVRTLLGICEGGVLPGIAFLLSKFYRRQELTYRHVFDPFCTLVNFMIFSGVLGPVLASQNIGAAVGGLIASGILKIDHIGSLKSWRNIFLIEGLITTVVAIGVFILVVDSPIQATWLTEDEKILAVRRLESEYPAVNEAAQHTRKQTIRAGLLNINAWLVALAFFFINVALQGAAVFLPTIIATLFPEKTAIQKQLLSVPPYFLGAIVQITSPYISMRMDIRSPFMIFHACVGAIAYAILVGSKSLHARYAACFLVAAGPFTFGTFSHGLVAINTSPDPTRVVALGVLSSMGQLGGIVSTWTYVASDAPGYHRGNTLNLAGMIAVIVLIVGTMVHMKWENAQRDHGKRDYRLNGLTPIEESQLGHRHPKFRYKI